MHPANGTHDKYLGLMEAVAYLHQHQRPVKTVDVDGQQVEYIEVTLEDIDMANALSNEVLGQSLDDLSRPSRTLLDAIVSMVKELSEKHNIPIEKVTFNRRGLTCFECVVNQAGGTVSVDTA